MERLWTNFLFLDGDLMALYNYSGLMASRRSLFNVLVSFEPICFAFWIVPSSSSAHCAPGKKAALSIYKVLVGPGAEADALTTRSRAGG